MYMYIRTEYTYISPYILHTCITPYIFLLVFKIVESLQCILKLTNKLKSNHCIQFKSSNSKGTVMQNERGLINDCLRVSKVSLKFRSQLFVVLQ